jgi:hypothetical protein
MALEGEQAVLGVYVVWHKAYADGAHHADALFRWLCGDPTKPSDRGIGIPVRFRTTIGSVDGLKPINYDPASRNAVVVLIDDEMVAAHWDSYLVNLLDARRGGRDIVIPVAIAKSAMHLDSRITAHNLFRLDEYSAEEITERLITRVTRVLCQLLAESQDKPQVFLSHSKSDGVTITLKVRRYLHEEVGIADFFDTTDIPDGDQFADVLKNAVGNSSVLLVTLTDIYGSREWCREEVLTAKRKYVPIVVLSAVDKEEARSFPYLGNIPVVRWTDSSDGLGRLVRVLLREVVRAKYFPLRVNAALSRYGIELCGRPFVYPPELLTALLLRSGRLAEETITYLYPDPPLGGEELDLIKELDPNLTPITLTSMVAR